MLTLNTISLLLAPGSYEVEKSEKNVSQSTSAYSFGLKYKDQKTDDIPGKKILISHYYCYLKVVTYYRKILH